MQTILAVSAHPDDETLGCGATLLRHGERGDEVHWVIATRLWEPLFTASSLETRQREIESVAAEYGMKSVQSLDFDTTRMDIHPLGDVIASTQKAIENVSPNIVYLVHRGDIHSDHKVTFDACIAALKPFRSGANVSILSYECVSSTEMAPPLTQNLFAPNSYCDVTEYFEKKLEILSLYKSEIMDPPHPRSLQNVRALAQYRGASISVDYAEAFSTIRQIL